MARRAASIKKALPAQVDLEKRREHCSVDAQLLTIIKREVRQQVRIKRNRDEYGLYTVSEAGSETGPVVRMGENGRERLGTTDVFEGVIDSRVVHPTMSECDARDHGELIERLDDHGSQDHLIAIAPHGGDIELHTDEQAELVASRAAASAWRCKGWHPGGAFVHWHITSTDINPASFPLLGKVFSRGFAFAVAFHGFDDDQIVDDILIGGSAGDELKCDIREAIEKATAGSLIKVRVARPDEANGGDDEDNIVNRLSPGHGIQIEQSPAARDRFALDIAAAVADVYLPMVSSG